jgi:hypothetical protein
MGADSAAATAFFEASAMQAGITYLFEGAKMGIFIEAALSPL